MNLFGSIGNGLHRLGTDITHPFGMGNPAPPQQQPIRTPAPVPQQAAAPRPIVRTPAPVQPSMHLPSQGQNGFGVLAPGHTALPNPTQQQLHPNLMHQVGSAIAKVGGQTGLGVDRAATGLAQNASGLVDLATPGTGTSRVTKGLINAGKSIDAQAAKTTGPAHAAYTIGQVSSNLASFLSPGAIAKGATAIPKVANIVDHASPALNVASKIVAPLDKGVGKVAANLATHGTGGRIAAAGIKGALSSNGLVNAAGGTISQIGNMASTGQKVTPGKVAGAAALNLGMSAGIPMAAQGVREAAPAIVKGAKGINTAVQDAHAKQGVVASYNATVRDLQKQKSALQNRVQNTTNFRGVNTTQSHIDNIDNQIAQTKANTPKLTIKDRLLSPNIGMSTQPIRPVDVPAATPAADTKVRGLTKGIKNSPEFSPQLQSKVSSKYTPFTDKAATQSTSTFMKQPLDEAHTQVLQALAKGQGEHLPGAAGNRGVQFGKQEVSNAGAVIKALDQAGRHDEASIIHDQLAQKLTNAGQTSQAAKLIYNRTPEGLQNMARKSFNDKGVKINPALQQKIDANINNIKAIDKASPIAQLNEANATAADQLSKEVASGKIGAVAKQQKSPEEMLANRIKATTDATKKQAPDPVKDMVNTLHSVAKEVLPAKGKAVPRNPMELISQSIKDKQNYGDVYNKAKVIVMDKYKDNPEALSELDKYFTSGIERTYSKGQLNKAVQNGLKGTDLSKLVKEHYTTVNETGSALKDRLIKEGGLSDHEATQLSQDIQNRFNELVTNKKQSLLANIFKDHPAPIQKSLVQHMTELSNMGALDSEHWRGQVSKKLGLGSMSPTQAAEYKAALGKVNDAANSRQRDFAIKQFERLVGTNLPTGAGTKALSLYKTGILSSPKTAVKVLGAGLPNLALENAADAIAAPIDRAVSLFTGKRTVTAPSINSMTAGAKALPKALSDAKIRFSKDIAMPGSTGLAGNELSGTVARPHGANFGIAKDGGRTRLDKMTGGVSSKFLNGYTSSIGRVHGAFQTLPYEVRAAQSLAQSAKAEAITQGLKGADRTAFIHDFTAHPENYGKAGKQALATADESAQYATSQQHTALGSAASSIQRTMPGGQIIAPITRIPGAVATQVVNYSPAGVLKTGIQAGLDKKAGLPFNQQGFSRGIGRSVVGTALMGGGAALALQGRVSGAYPKDKATQQLWTSANIPANSVYVGGKAYPNEPWKNSGGTWQQISSPGGAGAQAGLTGGSVVDGYKNGGTAGAVLGGTQGAAQIVTNQPYLTGVSGAMGAINTPTQAKSFFDQTAGSVVPNALRDVASSTDPLQRQTSVQSPITSMKNSITNGIPRLREKNQPQVDTMGNTLQRNNDPLTAALNPLNPQKSTPSDLTNAMGAIHNSKDVNGKPLPIPTQIDKKYTIKDASGKTSALSDAQRTQFIQSTGQASQAQLNKLMATDAYKNATPEQQSKMMGDIVSGQRDLGKQQLGNATKLTAAGKSARDGVLPTIGMNGKVTATGGKLDLPKGMNGNDVATLERYNGMKPADKTKIMTTEPDAQYKLQLAEYERDKRLGTKTPQQLQTQEEALNKAKIGSTFSPEVRNTYDMGKNDAFNYIATNKNGGQLSKDVIAYGDALAKAGIENNKFVDSKGNITITPKGKMVVPGDKVTATAQSNGVPADIFAALVKQESGGNQGAVSPVGAIGLTQLMPDTAKTLGVDPRNPDQNLAGGAKYLKQMYDKFGKWDLALAAYNAGPGAVEKYHGIPPYTETQNYVKNIMGMVKNGIKGSDYNLILDDPNAATNALNQSGVDTQSSSARTASASGAVSKAAVSYSGVGNPARAANSKFSVGKLKTGMGSGKVSIKSYKVPKVGTSHIARNRPTSNVSLNAKLPKRSTLI